jgi:arylsulfatase A-like enzyme
LPFLRGERAARERAFFWRHQRQAAAREGRWKYLKLDEKTERLFDLSTDEREQADFRAARPEVFESLRGKYLSWESQMLKRPQRP